MTDLIYEFETTDPLAEDLSALLREANTDLFRAKQQWRTSVWEPYQQGLLQKERRTFEFPVDVKTSDEDELFFRDLVEFELDDDLFNSLVALYAQYGWRGFQAFKPIIDKQQTFPRQEMLYATLQRVDDLVANRLIDLQRQATELGHRNCTEQLKWLSNEKQRFILNKSYDKYELKISIDKLNELYPLLNKCRHIQNKIRALDEKIAERNRKDGGDDTTIKSRRERDEYRRKFVKLFQDPKDESIKKLEEIQKRIGELYAPALLILNELDGDLDFVLTTSRKLKLPYNSSQINKSRKVELTYQDKIYHCLREIHDAVVAVDRSYGNPGIESVVRQYQSLNMRKRYDAGGVHHVVLAKVLEEVPGVASYIENSIRYGVAGLYFTKQQISDYHLVNRVLGKLSIIALLQDSMLDERATSFQRAVLMQYSLDLKRALESQKKREEFYNTLWHALEVATAVAGLLLAVLSIPFGGGAVAVPAAITATLSALSLTTLALGIPLLVNSLLQLIDGVLSTEKKLQQKVEELLRQEMLELGQIDPEALLELSVVLYKNHLLLEQASEGILIELIKLAGAHQLKPIAFMIDMEGYLDDMETLGASF
jgi:hypothetical protein